MYPYPTLPLAQNDLAIGRRSPSVGGLLRQPVFAPNPLDDTSGGEPSTLSRVLMITPPLAEAPSPLSVVRFKSFNAGAEVGAGRGLALGLALGLGAAILLSRL